MNGIILASIPCLPASYLLLQLLFEHNPIQTMLAWLLLFLRKLVPGDDHDRMGGANGLNGNGARDDFIDSLKVAGQYTSSQLLAYVLVALFGYFMTDYLIPAIKVRGLILSDFVHVSCPPYGMHRFDST